MPEPRTKRISTTTAAILAAVSVGLVALLRWWLHPSYGSGPGDFILLAVLFFLVLSLVSGSFGPGIIEWSRRQARFRIIAGDDDPVRFQTHYGLTLMAVIVFAFILFWLPNLK